jgi:hypothetical protein
MIEKLASLTDSAYLGQGRIPRQLIGTLAASTDIAETVLAETLARPNETESLAISDDLPARWPKEGTRVTETTPSPAARDQATELRPALTGMPMPRISAVR